MYSNYFNLQLTRLILKAMELQKNDLFFNEINIKMKNDDGINHFLFFWLKKYKQSPPYIPAPVITIILFTNLPLRRFLMTDYYRDTTFLMV